MTERNNPYNFKLGEYNWNRIQDLQERTNKFQAMELPGQPQSMHMGTSYLIGSLISELMTLMHYAQWLEAEIEDVLSK